MARPEYAPSITDRNTVKSMAACGFTHEDIARCIGDYGISAKTLRKHFQHELDTAHTMANAKVGSIIYQQALQGDAWACCFWMKARAGWRETQELKISGSLSAADVLRERFRARTEGAPKENNEISSE